MRDLTDASPAAIAAERARVPHEGIGAEILASQESDGSWHRTDTPVWLPTLYTLLLLRATGVDPAEPAAHPEIEIVNRDRASLYAEAATKAAPQAVQVADRWHLLRNLSKALVEALAPHHRRSPRLRAPRRKSPSLETEAIVKPPPAKPTSRHRRLIEDNRELRMAHYEAVMALLQRDIAQREIARQCGLSRKTVRRFIRAQGFPERKQRRSASLVDRHRNYLEMRRQQGCHNSARLWRELRSQGFVIRPHPLRDWMHKHYGPRGCRDQPRSHPSTLYALLRGKSPGGC